VLWNTYSPVVTALLPPQPNPFNPLTQIRFSLGTAGRIALVIYDLRGQKVRTLVDCQMPAGPHSVEWAGTDEQGRSVSSGLYLLRMAAGGLQLTQKLHLLR
jgi:flagellar hook assembly protein FlgD